MGIGEAIIAAGTVISGVIGAIGLWWIRILNKRAKIELDRAAEERKDRRDTATAARREKKETTDELWTVIDALKSEVADGRNQVHEMRNQLQAVVTREAACQKELADTNADLARMGERVQHLEDRLQEEGITVRPRPPNPGTQRRRDANDKPPAGG